MKVEKILGEHDWGFAITSTVDIPDSDLELAGEYRGNSSQSSAAGINWNGEKPPSHEAAAKAGLFRLREVTLHGGSLDDIGNRATKVVHRYYRKKEKA